MGIFYYFMHKIYGRLPVSRSTITLPNDLLEELMRSVEAKSKTEAVIMAIRDEIRLKKIEKIRSMAGKMEFVRTAEEIRHGDERLG
jgi:metal-responsive CopG/Arc/MetJ family transcriptional regulator